MMSFLWSILSLSWAVEGLDVGIQSPMSLHDLNQPWNLHIDHQFWIQPVVYSENSWVSLPVSDVLLQRFSVHHRLNRDWSVNGEIPLIFVGSKELTVTVLKENPLCVTEITTSNDKEFYKTLQKST